MTDINEGGFEAVFEVLDASLEDGAYFACVSGALDLEFFKDAVLQLSDALLEWLGVNDEFREGLVFLFNGLDDAADERLLFGALGSGVAKFPGVDSLCFFLRRRSGQVLIVVFGLGRFVVIVVGMDGV